MRNFKTTLVFLFLCTLVNAQVSIPFRLTDYNNMIVKALVNHKDSVDLMFQIAMDDGALSPDRIHKAETIVFDNEEYSASNTVQIQGIEWNNVSFVNNQYSGQESDGKIGTILFKDKIFEINYDRSELISHQEMPALEGYQPVKLTFRNGAMFIEVKSEIGEESFSHQFYLQSGYSGAILYDDIFSDKNQLSDKLKTISEKTLKNSKGQSIITKHAVVPQLAIGNFVLEHVSVGYFSGELRSQPFSLFGADMLKRFNWIINADRTMAWIKPSKYFKDDFFKVG